MCLISLGGKRLSPMNSNEQVAQGIKNNAKIVIANVENDEFMSVNNDVELEIPPAQGRFCTKPKYNVLIRFGLTRQYCI